VSLLLLKTGEAVSPILEEVEEKQKLDKVRRVEFCALLQYNIQKLMEEQGYLRWETSQYETPSGIGEMGTPIPKCSASEFVKRLKATDPKAYKKLIKQSLNPEWYSQKGHRYLVRKARQKLESTGYKVYGGKSEKAIERLRKLNQGWLVGICQGKDRYPDLIAFRHAEVLIVEVASSKTKLVRQLNYDQMAGKTVLVLPIPIRNLKVWGISELYEEESKKQREIGTVLLPS